MASNKEDSRNQDRNDSKVVPSDIDGQILRALELPKIQHAEEIAANAKIAPATFYNHREGLEKANKIVSAKIGKEVLYALEKNKVELFISTGTRSEIENRIIRMAAQTMDEINRVAVPFDKEEIDRILFKCYLVEEAVEVLRESNPELPTLATGNYKTPRDVEAFLDTMYSKKHTPYQLLYWYGYFVRVLRALGMGPPVPSDRK